MLTSLRACSGRFFFSPPLSCTVRRGRRDKEKSPNTKIYALQLHRFFTGALISEKRRRKKEDDTCQNRKKKLTVAAWDEKGEKQKRGSNRRKQHVVEGHHNGKRKKQGAKKRFLFVWGYMCMCVCFGFFVWIVPALVSNPAQLKKKKMIFLSPRLQLEKQSVFLSVIRPIYLQTPSLTTNVILRCCVCTFFFFFFVF